MKSTKVKEVSQKVILSLCIANSTSLKYTGFAPLQMHQIKLIGAPFQAFLTLLKQQPSAQIL